MEGSEPTFEAAFQELEQTVAILEQGGLTLEEAIRVFERGIELAAHCSKLLDAAELRVSRLVGDELPSGPDDGPGYAF